MILNKADGIYVAHSSFAEKDIPKGAGLRWNQAMRKWWTDDINAAARLWRYADDTCRAELEAIGRGLDSAVKASRAVEVDIEIPVPDGLEYMPFQRAGIAYAVARPATLIGDEMGLGKTIQAIGVINYDASISRVLVVCPASLKLNWARELDRWLVRNLRVAIATSQYLPSPHAVQSTLVSGGAQRGFICIANWDILRKHSRRLEAMAWDLIIADEVHYAKSENAQRSQAFYALTAKRRLFLSGTPIVNKPKELWAIIHALDPVTWDKPGEYHRKYCTEYGMRARMPELQRRLRASIMVRRLKADVLTDLPPKRRQVIEVPAGAAAAVLSREQSAWADKEASLSRLKAAVELAKASDDIGEYRDAVKALKEGVSVAFSEISKVRHETAVAKVPAVIDHLRESLDGGGKVVVMAHHKDVVAGIAQAFGKQAVQLTGEMDMGSRQVSVDRFQRDDSVRLFIGSIQAAGVGITLTASSHVVFAELDWVPGNMTQAEDRCHRIGQRDSVLVQHLVLEGSIDANMARTLIEKQEVIEKALDVEEQAVVIPEHRDRAAATANVSREQVEREALGLSDAQVEAIHDGLRMLTAMDGDRARELNGVGFNQMDSAIGHSLAACARLTPKQAALGLRICGRYKRQLPDDLVAQAMGEAVEVVA